MTRLKPLFVFSGALVGAMAAQAEPDKIVLRNIDLHPATTAAAKRTLRRIDAAALQVCGASDTALREVRTATRKAECWREAAGGAVRQSGDPLLAQAFARIAPATR